MGGKHGKLHVCPWWLAYTFDNPLRRLFHRDALLSTYLRPGMTVLDAGCGMGYFSIMMARLVSPGGRVVSLDLQQKMLDTLMRRARRAGIEGIIEPYQGIIQNIKKIGDFDFCLAFWMVHEVPDQPAFARSVKSLLGPGGRLLIAEPSFHVSQEYFDETVEIFVRGGLNYEEAPLVRLSRAALFSRPDG